MTSYFFSVAFIFFTGLMAFLFGPLGFLPSIFYFVSRIRPTILESLNSPDEVKTPIKSVKAELILVLCGTMSIATWQLIKISFNEESILKFFVKLSDFVVIPTAAAKHLNSIDLNLSRQLSARDFSLDAFGLQICSILMLALVFSVGATTKQNYKKNIALMKSKTIYNESLDAKSFSRRFILLFAFFVFFNSMVYFMNYSDNRLTSTLLIRLNIFMASIYPLIILVDVLMISIWTRRNKT
jgi:hypothetical protein